MSVLTADERPEYLTVAEIAEELRCSEPTIRRRIASGELEAVKLGQGRNSAVRVRRSALEDFVSRGAA